MNDGVAAVAPVREDSARCTLGGVPAWDWRTLGGVATLAHKLAQLKPVEDTSIGVRDADAPDSAHAHEYQGVTIMCEADCSRGKWNEAAPSSV